MRERSPGRAAGFSMAELMVALATTLVLLAAALATFADASGDSWFCFISTRCEQRPPGVPSHLFRLILVVSIDYGG